MPAKEWLNECGLRFRMNPSLHRFEGKIKVKPEDFEVTEINLNGEKASVEIKSVPKIKSLTGNKKASSLNATKQSPFK